MFHYENNILKFFATAEGYVNVTTGGRQGPNGSSYVFSYIYNYTDHLGNIRLSYTANRSINLPPVIMEENHYYPFGLKHKKYGSVDKELVGNEEGQEFFVGIEVVPPGTRKSYQYKVQNKEWQDELGLNVYDFHARLYDPSYVKTLTLDPLAEKFYDLSPYSFLNNNPINFIDPDGREGKPVLEEDCCGDNNDRPFGQPDYVQSTQNNVQDNQERTNNLDNTQPNTSRIEKLKHNVDVTGDIGGSAEAIKALDQYIAEITKGNPSKVLGKFGKVGGVVSSGGSIAVSGLQYVDNEISGFELTFDVGATLTSVWVGGKVGASFGGPKGFVAGVTVSAVSEFVVKPIYKNHFYPKVVKPAENSYNRAVSRFYNNIIFNISRYH